MEELRDRRQFSNECVVERAAEPRSRAMREGRAGPNRTGTGMEPGVEGAIGTSPSRLIR